MGKIQAVKCREWTMATLSQPRLFPGRLPTAEGICLSVPLWSRLFCLRLDFAEDTGGHNLQPLIYRQFYRGLGGQVRRSEMEVVVLKQFVPRLLFPRSTARTGRAKQSTERDENACVLQEHRTHGWGRSTVQL